MQALTDAPPATYCICVDVHGRRIGVRTNLLGVVADLAAHLPVGWRALATPRVDRWYGLDRRDAGVDGCRPVYVLEVAGRQLVQSEAFSEVWQRFEYELELDVAEHSPDYVFLHAGVVGWRGRAMVIPGRSYSGKSTLVAALCQAGADYYSDEYALLDPQGRVHAYPRALRLRQPVPDVSVPAEAEFSSACGRLPLSVGLVVITHHQPGADWQPTSVPTSQAMLELLGHALSVQRQPRVVLAVLGEALADARAVRGPRGEAKETAERLLRWAA
jgi:hypothetical protein